MDVGVPELLIILVVALVIFGPTKLPQLARSIGEAIRELHRGSQDRPEEDNDVSAPPDDSQSQQ